jgi:secreted trypsin-like serine protease
MKFKELLLMTFVEISVICANASGKAVKKQPLKCGLRPVGIGNVIGVNHTILNSWPWLVALRYKPTNEFFCGGSLITARYIISGK